MKKTVDTLADIPHSQHYAIFSIRSIYIPGDERSRTCPGHGYPAENVNVVNYKIVTSENELKQELSYIKDLSTVRVAKISPLTITQHVTFSIHD